MTELKLTKANDEMVKLRQRACIGKTIDIAPHVKGKDSSKFALHAFTSLLMRRHPRL